MILKDPQTSSTSEEPKVKSALLDKYKEDHQKEVWLRTFKNKRIK